MKKGFTLIEILVIIMIIAILIVVIISVLGNPFSDKHLMAGMTATATSPLPDGVTKFTDGPFTCYVFNKFNINLLQNGWSGGISCVIN